MTAKLLGAGLLLVAVIGLIYPGKINPLAFNDNDSPPPAVSEAVAVDADPRPLVVQIASAWPADSIAQQPRVVCRQGLCAARQGPVVAVAESADRALDKLQRRTTGKK